MNLGPYTGFIVAAYLLTVAVVGALIMWVLLDYRVQRKILADLEARGVARRSELAP
jgi:heme exporter protein D